jgi:transposase
MARDKPYDDAPMQMLPISVDRQIRPGTFEDTLDDLIDEKIDLSVFEARSKNDAGGAPADDPAMLLKIMLCAYSTGIIDSRRIEPRCREHVVGMALSADTVPHFTTMAHVVSSRSAASTMLFRHILLGCDAAGLIGQEMFAIDGGKLPSHASQAWSGTKADLTQKAQQMRRAVAHLLSKHQASDAADVDTPLQTAAARQMKTLNAAIEQVESFLATHEDKIGTSGKPKPSNITENDSAKMPTSKGVIQGYGGLALADRQPQVVVHAEAFGEGQERGLLVPMLQGGRETFNALNLSEDSLQAAKRTADAGYSSADNAESLFANEIDAYIADHLCRTRDPRVPSAKRHKPTRADESFATPKKDRKFQPTDVQLAPDHAHAICPAGKRLYKAGRHRDWRGSQTLPCRGTSCPWRQRCVRHPERPVVRHVACIVGRAPGTPEQYRSKMKRKIDRDIGRYEYSRRLGIIEPVCGTIRNTKRLNRLTRRGKRKVNAQWPMYGLGHNIEKIQRDGQLHEQLQSR